MSETVEVKLRRDFATKRLPGGPAKVGAVRAVPKAMAESMIARGIAVPYDEKQKVLDKAAEEAAKAKIEAEASEAKAAEEAAAAHRAQEAKKERQRRRSGIVARNPAEFQKGDD